MKNVLLKFGCLCLAIIMIFCVAGCGNKQTASFDEDDDYDQMDSQGFINLFGLPITVKAKKDLAKGKKLI